MSVRDIVQAAAGSTSVTYVDDVFSTYLYTGNGSTQTINNGIDLAGKGGLVWTKSRSNVSDGRVVDTVSGIDKDLRTNLADAQATSTVNITSVSSSGYSIGSGGGFNNNTYTFVSWTFRKAQKFFDVVTWTGDGVNGRIIPHSLGVSPGCIIVKCTSASTSWFVWHRGLTSQTNGLIWLEQTTAQITDTSIGYNAWNSTAPTSTGFSVGAGSNSASGTNFNTATYVAYLFAHDTAADGLIQCGSFTTDASGNASVTLGWEPQFVLWKRTDGVQNWKINDSARGMTVGSNDVEIYPNTSGAETANGGVSPTATGFYTDGGSPSMSFIYIAIRRPNKPPTSGSQVYNAVPYTGNSATNRQITGVGFSPDLSVVEARNTVARAATWFDRLRGLRYLQSDATAAETASTSNENRLDQDGFTVDGSNGILNYGTVAAGYSSWNFRRAPGFFDVVTYTSSGTVGVPHSLGVLPQLMIQKSRNAIGNWLVVYTPTENVNSTYFFLESTNAGADWGNVYTRHNASTFENWYYDTSTRVAYLFATLPGIQYINSYVGDGTTGRVINCGFSSGARFVMIKATSTTGSWWIFDSARGIVAAADPVLQLNSTAAEITSADAVDPSASGFIVNQEATCSLNATGVTYLVWAIA